MQLKFNKGHLDKKIEPGPYDSLIKKALELGANEAKVLKTNQVVFDPRAHLKCRFGCRRWGRFLDLSPSFGNFTRKFSGSF